MSDRVLAKVKGDIERFGWSAIGVFPAEGDDPSATFTYTIGLIETEQHPELIVYGLAHDQAHGLLYSAVMEIRAGAVLAAGGRYPRVLESFDVESVAVPADGYPLNVARAYYDSDVDAVQIRWPDADGRFPDDPDVDPLTAMVQVQVRS